MKNSKIILTLMLSIIVGAGYSQEVVAVDDFEKIIVSPHVKVNFVAGNTPSVSIEDVTIDRDKVNIEVNGKTLRVYLDDAKEVTKNVEVMKNGYKTKQPIYKGTVLTITIVYKELKGLEIRGEEKNLIASKIKQNSLNLKIYGESQIAFSEVSLEELKTKIYGESRLEINSGSIENHHLTIYGEGQANLENINNDTTKLVVYGDGEVKLNVSKELKISAYGDASVGYKGGARIKKGLVIGDAKIYTLN